MAENLIISDGSKEEKYAVLYGQVKALAEGEDDIIANMANISSMIHQTFGFWWTGFYRVCGQELVLGPFQGPLACSRIRFGRGVCGTAWKEARTIVVPDVELFPGHIACSSDSRSEIVVPVFNTEEREIIAVLDIDSAELNTFDQIDKEWLEKIVVFLV
jgi:GAF domain-containing protein